MNNVIRYAHMHASETLSQERRSLATVRTLASNKYALLISNQSLALPHAVEHKARLSAIRRLSSVGSSSSFSLSGCDTLRPRPYRGLWNAEASGHRFCAAWKYSSLASPGASISLSICKPSTASGSDVFSRESVACRSLAPFDFVSSAAGLSTCRNRTTDWM